MAHNLNGDSMMYVGEEPWHGIGTKLNKPATAEEAITAAKLNYVVSMTPALYQNKKGYNKVEDRYFTIREDTGMYLSDYALSGNYKVIQNVEAFGFFDSVVGSKQAIYQTTGALGRGERIWILAKLPSEIVLKDDRINKFLLLTNSHDGKSTLKMYFTPVRVVCQNTLIMSQKDSKGGISIRHRGDIKSKIQVAQEVLGIAKNYYNNLEKEILAMMGFQMDTKLVDSYYSGLLKIKNDGEDSTRLLNQKDAMLLKFDHGKGNDNPKIRHSLWAAYNGVTEYVDHFKTIRNVEKNPSGRLEDIWFGNGSNIKQRAYEQAMVLLSK